MKRVVLLLLAVWMAIGTETVRAGLDANLSVAVQNTAPGYEIIFSGTLTNTSTTSRIFLNDLQISGGPSQLALRTNGFFANVPGILLPGETYSGPVFGATITNGAATGDYRGTVTFLGGINIFATGALDSVNFALLSPAVTIVATVAEASEYGPVSGAMRVSRSGGTDIALDVAGLISGDAINGIHYSPIGTPQTIPAGAASVTFAIAPIPDDVAQGDRTATVSIAGSSTYTIGPNASATVIIHDKPADAWRLQKFGAGANTAAAADLADWDGDGIPNLVDYALGLDPTVPMSSAVPTPFQAGDYLALSYTPNPAAIDVTYSVEGSEDLETWSANLVEPFTLSPPSPTLLSFRYKSPISAGQNAFLRLRITRLTSP